MSIYIYNKEQEDELISRFEQVLLWPKDIENFKKNVREATKDINEIYAVESVIDEIINTIAEINEFLIINKGYKSFPYRFLSETFSKLQHQERYLINNTQKKVFTSAMGEQALAGLYDVLWSLKTGVSYDENMTQVLASMDLKSLSKDFENLKNKYDALIDSIESAEKNVVKQNDYINRIKNDVDSFYTVAKANKEELDTIHTNIKSLTPEITSNAEKIKTTVANSQKELDGLFDEIDNLKSDASVIIKSNENDTSSLLERLQEIEKDITAKLESATGISLFHSFENRKGNIVSSKWVWFWLSIVCSLALCVGGPAIFYKFKDFALYIRVGLVFPLFYILGFSTKQYANERRLEEVYALKSNISLSLKAYQEVIKEMMIDKTLDIDVKKECVDFMVESIRNIFSSPLKEEKKEVDKEVSVLKESTDILSDTLKTVSNFVNKSNSQ